MTNNSEPIERPPGRVVEALRCPVCAQRLRRSANALRCPAGHSFDIARQGYVNLLPTRIGTADTAGMVAARADFLAAGHYRSLAELVAERAAEHLTGGLVMDSGAGTGYYLGAVLERSPGAAGLAVDVSTIALRRAARAHPNIGAVAWDVWQPWPVRSATASVLLNVFAPRNGDEFHRVLRPDGTLLVVTPTEAHLAELGTAAGLLGIDQRKDERLETTLSQRFRLIDRVRHASRLALSAEDVGRVVRMGPAGHHLPTGDAEPVARPATVTASFVLSVYQPKPAG